MVLVVGHPSYPHRPHNPSTTSHPHRLFTPPQSYASALLFSRVIVADEKEDQLILLHPLTLLTDTEWTQLTSFRAIGHA